LGATARVGSVARGWSALAVAMEAAGAAIVSCLPPEQLVVFSRRLWVIPPDA
jgi:hypothetical protein